MKKLLVGLFLSFVLPAARNWVTNTHNVTVGDQSIYDFGTSTSYTISLWVKHDVVGAVQRYASKQDVDVWAVRLSSGSKLEAVVGRVAGTLQTLTATTSLSTGTWYHVAFVRNVTDDNIKLYLSTATTAVTEDASATDTTVNPHGDGSMVIGKYASGTGETMQGTLANIMIFDRALTVGELENVKWCRYVGQSRIGFWQLNGHSTEPDLSGSVKNATVSGTTVVDNPPTRICR